VRSLSKAVWFVVSLAFLATAVFVPVRIRYRQNEPLPAPAPGAVVIANYEFVPSNLTVERGPVTISFNNTDGAAHTATADDGSFDTGKIGPGQTLTVSVTKTVSFHCDIHRSMTATIDVKG
jgi:plastocyanin